MSENPPPKKEKPKTARDHPLYTRDCQLCGTPIALVRDHFGKTQVLDLRAPVWTPAWDRSGPGQSVVIRNQLSFVTHFSTCPYANEFSASKKKAESGEDVGS